jgi:nickel-dependent lactate racemase
MTGINQLYGTGAAGADLSADELRRIVIDALSSIPSGSRVLAIIPDKTRDDNTDLLFPFAAEALQERGVENLDVLVAQGTHSPMSEAEKLRKIGAYKGNAPLNVGSIYDHQWNKPEELTTIGQLSSDQVREITGGLIRDRVSLSVNRLLAPGIYDNVLIFGATVPHEVAGFAGGAKYFFPGVAGPELTHATHWLGALATIEQTIGRIETPTRHLIEAAADKLTQNVVCFTTVVSRTDDKRLRTHALFAGDFRQSIRSAAEISAQIHIKTVDGLYKRVIAILDERYDEMWVGGKASYKLGGIIEPGGELIIYAPRLDALSTTHGKLIEKYGYSPLENVRRLVAENADLRENLCVSAHLAHVAYAGRNGSADPAEMRYRITLATGINGELCKQVNLGFLDHRSFSVREFEKDKDTLIVDHAGRDLYRLKA